MPWISRQLSSLIGQHAEQRACEYLQQQNLVHVISNYRCRSGEIDLIMQEGEQWVFVEVKYRKSSSHGEAMEYFHPHKRKKFELAVAHYLHEKKLNPAMTSYRIDVLAIQGQHIEWLKGV
ncbi:YraN family protein [Alteromonadaceae bacterium BrNp21-10]|nr:YraN family protein [Alteromonadaceae bacterium BrNp21-10]